MRYSATKFWWSPWIKGITDGALGYAGFAPKETGRVARKSAVRSRRAALITKVRYRSACFGAATMWQA